MSKTSELDRYDRGIIVKVGDEIKFRLKRDFYPEITNYILVEDEELGLITLMPINDHFMSKIIEEIEKDVSSTLIVNNINFDNQIQKAFFDLKKHIQSSIWSESAKPYTDLINLWQEAAENTEISRNIQSYLKENPRLKYSIKMLLTTISMSARAEWDKAPPEIRGIVARGWFIGRWLPTFLVIDGPITEFLKDGRIFKPFQEERTKFIRAMRQFFDTIIFMRLRHSLAHWSFNWVSDGNDSKIIGYYGKKHQETVSLTRREADAFHIISFALVESFNNIFLNKTDYVAYCGD